VWSAGRIADGWRWGPERDDVLKENPCLVPYDELPEREKVYDRKTSVETLKLIVALGYTIERRC
jgi:ryanodine receptor 2